MATELLPDFRVRPQLEVARYDYPHARNFHFSVHDRASGTVGFGGGATAAEAQRKALFEWIERRVFRLSQVTTSSSGWAAHTTARAARRAAELELVERDAVLVSWLLRIPPRVRETALFPAFGRAFPLLQFGEGAGFLILGALVENGNGRMLISTACATLEEGLAKLRIDSERARHLLDTGGLLTVLAEHHEAFCAIPAAELGWLEGGGEGLRYGELAFTTRHFEATLWDGSLAFVAEARSDQLQPLFFGPTTLRSVRRSRLRALRKSGRPLNRGRHPIL